MKKPPNPGSDAAIALGCRCAVLDNAHGKGFPYPGAVGPAFYINLDCPVHGGSPNLNRRKAKNQRRYMKTKTTSTSSLKIDRGIPLPPKYRPTVATSLAATLRAMSVGDSIFLKGHTMRKMGELYTTARNLGNRLAARSVTGGVRVWKAA